VAGDQLIRCIVRPPLISARRAMPRTDFVRTYATSHSDGSGTSAGRQEADPRSDGPRRAAGLRSCVAVRGPCCFWRPGGRQAV